LPSNIGNYGNYHTAAMFLAMIYFIFVMWHNYL
jgi:hypothetical protein